ncbi:kelch-like protein 23 isoform X2 [Babylonia areolata]
MYSGTLVLNSDSVEGLLKAADLWQMTEVKTMCEDYMERLVDASNCLGVWRFAEDYSCQRLAQRSEQLLKQRFPLVAQGPEFLRLNLPALLRVLSFPELSLGHEGEGVVVRALTRWLDHNQAVSADKLAPLLQAVNWSDTSLLCRQRFLDQHPVISSTEELQQIVNGARQDQGQGRRRPQTTLYVIGGFLQARTGPKCPRLRSVERLDTLTSRWTACADLPMMASAAIAFNLYGHLFCCSCEPIPVAHSSTTVTRTEMFEYNMMRDQWLPVGCQFSVDVVGHINTCLQDEGALAVCPETSAIYTVSKSEVAHMAVTSLEGDIVCNTVRLLQRPHVHFSEQHRQHAAIVVDRRLYVLGGDRHDGGTDPVPTTSVMAFDLHDKTWSECASMLEPRIKLAVAALKGKIYTCGGFNIKRLASMETYDPHTDQWTALTPMNKYRSHHQLLVLHNTLWAIGGKSYAVSNGGARKVLNSCEVYDPDTDTWTESEGHNMKNARCGFAALAI